MDIDNYSISQQFWYNDSDLLRGLITYTQNGIEFARCGFEVTRDNELHIGSATPSILSVDKQYRDQKVAIIRKLTIPEYKTTNNIIKSKKII
jgi:hypothetical protein